MRIANLLPIAFLLLSAFTVLSKRGRELVYIKVSVGFVVSPLNIFCGEADGSQSRTNSLGIASARGLDGVNERSPAGGILYRSGAIVAGNVPYSIASGISGDRSAGAVASTVAPRSVKQTIMTRRLCRNGSGHNRELEQSKTGLTGPAQFTTHCLTKTPAHPIHDTVRHWIFLPISPLTD